MSLIPPIDTSVTRQQQLLACARGETPCDLVLKNGRVVNTFTGEILGQDVGIFQGRIAGVGQYRGHSEIDLKGRYLCPGFIEGHIHIESSMLNPARFAGAVVPRGTTAVVCDPHEIANVLGMEGVRYMLESGKNLPLDIFSMIPSCVPATDMETSGATLNPEDIDALLGQSGVPGLAEMMNFPGTIGGAPEILAKLQTALNRGLVIDGHAPGVTGKQLQAYCGAGISSDHECTTLEEAREKLRAGMYIFIREGSTAKNLEALLPLITPESAQWFLLVSDDRHPDDLMARGHLDHILRRAVALGLDPVTALKMVTINPAIRFDLKMRGALAPGYLADAVVVDDLSAFTVHQVYKNGELVAERGQSIDQHFPTGQMDKPAWLDHIGRPQQRMKSPHFGTDRPVPEEFSDKPPCLDGKKNYGSQRVILKNCVNRFSDKIVSSTGSVHIDWSAVDFRIPARNGKIRVIECVEEQIITGMVELMPTISGNEAVADPARDLLKISVIERHRASGNMTNGFVRGFGLQEGAMASTVAHDSHNLIVVGTNEELMLAAARLVADSGGGLALLDHDGSIVLPLQVGGLMSMDPLQEVAESLSRLKHFAGDMKISIKNPFMLLSFLALPVIPALKITDKGLVDVIAFQTVPLWIE